MITHVAVFTWAEGTTADQVAEIEAALLTLPELIPSIRRYTVGANAGLVDGNADFAVVATFDDVDGWRAYEHRPRSRADEGRADQAAPRAANRPAVRALIPSPAPAGSDGRDGVRARAVVPTWRRAPHR